MAQFLDHTTIRRELLGLFRTAEKFIFLVSPYIKLNEEMREALSRKKNDENFSIKVLFGKNEADKKSSLKEVDLDFFMDFKNVEIYYYADLHAKYYANEDKAIITSLNLHEYSLKNNIEIGVLVEQKLFDFGKESKIDNEAFDYFEKLFEKSEKVYVKKYNSTNYLFGLLKGKSKLEVTDKRNEVFNDSGIKNKQNNQSEFESKLGFCIRTGVSIPFNVNKPFTKEAFESWNKFQNPDYKEKFCHFSGEPSDGTICFSKPILRKNWNKAKEFMN